MLKCFLYYLLPCIIADEMFASFLSFCPSSDFIFLCYFSLLQFVFIFVEIKCGVRIEFSPSIGLSILWVSWIYILMFAINFLKTLGHYYFQYFFSSVPLSWPSGVRILHIMQVALYELNRFMQLHMMKGESGEVYRGLGGRRERGEMVQLRYNLKTITLNF